MTAPRLITPTRLAALSLLGLLPCLVSSRAFAQDSATAQAPAPAPTAGDVNSNEVVKMDVINVTTDIGSYHEETSSMATKVPTDLKELASSLQILNQNGIADRNAITLQDVFSYFTGVTQNQTNINGFTFRGLPVSGSYDQNIEFDGLMGTPLKKSAQSAADVDNLEFLKGPNTVLYGQMHPGGLMNIVSKSPEAEPSTVIRVTGFTYEGAFNRQFNKNGGTFMVDTTGAVDKGQHLLYRLIVDVEDNPPSRPGDFDKLISIFPSITYRFSSTTSFTVKLEADQDYRRQDDGLIPVFTSPVVATPVGTPSAAYGKNAAYYYAPFNTVYQNTYDFGRDKGEALSTAFHTAIGPWTIRLATRSVWHSDLTQEDTDNNASVFTPKASYATPGTTITRQYNNILNGHRWNSFDLNAFAKFGPDTFQHTVIVGAGGGTEQFDNQRLGFGPNAPPAISIINPIINQPFTGGVRYPANGTAPQNVDNYSTSMGEYVSDQMRILQRLHVTYGIRNDQYVQAGFDTLNIVKTPYQQEVIHAIDEQVGAVFDITDLLSVYASWSQSTTPNTVTDVNAQGQSGFPPEAGMQLEEGLKFETPNRKLFASLCYFYIDRTNVLVAENGITLPVTGQAVFRVDGAQHSEGFEFESEWQPIHNWQVQVGATASKAFIAASLANPYSVGDDLATAPRASGSLWTRYNFPDAPLKGLGVGLGAIYVGKYWGGDPTTVTYFAIPGYTRIDSALYYKWKRYSMALNIQNLMDRRYIQNEQSAEYVVPGEERKITLSITTRL